VRERPGSENPRQRGQPGEAAQHPVPHLRLARHGQHPEDGDGDAAGPGFVLDKADSNLGTVSGTKLNDYALRITVTVRPRGETQAVVRANAQMDQADRRRSKPYQEFFAALEKAMFLKAHEVD